LKGKTAGRTSSPGTKKSEKIAAILPRVQKRAYRSSERGTVAVGADYAEKGTWRGGGKEGSDSGLARGNYSLERELEGVFSAEAGGTKRVRALRILRVNFRVEGSWGEMNRTQAADQQKRDTPSKKSETMSGEAVKGGEKTATSGGRGSTKTEGVGESQAALQAKSKRGFNGRRC